VDINDFDYKLPPELIAQYPPPHREDSRLLVLDRAGGAIEHRCFPDVLDYLQSGDLLVMNQTKVFPARLLGRRQDTGGSLEVMLLEEKSAGIWEALVKPGRRARSGQVVIFGEGELRATIGEHTPEGGRVVYFDQEQRQHFWDLIFKLGQVPLPPYIKRAATEEDKVRYQTVYAQSLGSVAAPTAGLHFTRQLLDAAEQKGVQLAYVLLHVGLGTFRPVRVADIEKHQMHSEYWKVSPVTAKAVNDTRSRGGKLVAVGTTTVRTLESAVQDDGRLEPGEGWTRLFIYPGYHFRVVDFLITNFHLPKSTLLMLISALAGRELIRKAYREAVEQRYRFFSYGDAMLIR
jgi:S-adenosylmethionine:tRNA ribosyltransferase-isomerase